MKSTCPLLISAVVAFAGLTAPESFAQSTNEAVPVAVSVPGTNGMAQNTAIIPVPRTNPGNWVARHEGFARQAHQGGIDILFLGDSITDFWRNRGSNVWNKYYAPRHAANFGISADRTQHVLWRLDNGEADGVKPRVVVLMIGTNNTGKENDHTTPRNTVPETIAGVQAVVADLRARLPDSKILLDRKSVV